MQEVFHRYHLQAALLGEAGVVRFVFVISCQGKLCGHSGKKEEIINQAFEMFRDHCVCQRP